MNETNPAPETDSYILVIDDEPDICEIVEMVLESSGFKVITCLSGQAGLAAFEKYRGKIRLVLLDIAMPGTNGLQVLEQFKAQQPDVPVILVSGYVGNSKEAISLGAASVITKPFTLDQLEKQIYSSL